MARKSDIKRLVNQRAWEVAQIMYYQFQADMYRELAEGNLKPEEISGWFPEAENDETPEAQQRNQGS